MSRSAIHDGVRRHDLEEYFDAALLPIASPVRRIPFSSPDDVEQLVRSNVPAILTGALLDWPAYRNWTPEYFKSRWGDRVLYAYETSWDGKSPYLFPYEEKRVVKRLADLVDASLQQSDYKLYNNKEDADEAYPGSSADLRYGAMIRSAGRLQPGVWMGSRGTRSGMHFDLHDNLHAMIFGSKAFLLVDPGSPNRLYPFKCAPSKSPVDPARVDWERFPKLKRCRIFIDRLDKGDVVFIPRRWWHYFVSTETAISSGCWFEWSGISNAERGPTSKLLSYLFRCGPTYVASFVGQLIWYGALNRPFPNRALGRPPIGWSFWQAYWHGVGVAENGGLRR